MQYKTMNQLRDMFLSFFEARGHYRLPSFPLIPQNDNSLLLINAGMAPLKPYYTGLATPPSKRMATSQKCIRTTDIDQVGKNARHGSFFEMLGNFSFGDYFKKETIHWAWEFLTQVIQIPKDKLHVSVYMEDDEAYDIWLNEIGFPSERIHKLGKEDNFWEHGVGGPCGPCSEIHFDRGSENGCGKPDCAVGCDCDRYMEIWNLVFPQFVQRSDGGYDPLVPAGIDTGMGLERLALVVQNAPTIFELDAMQEIRKQVIKATGDGNPVSINIITDHARAVTFMTADGVMASNEGRGYVLRRLLRRAVRHGRMLGVDGAFIHDVIAQVIHSYSHAYPELEQKKEHILSTLTKEESSFLQTLETGLALLQKRIDALKGKTLPGADAFKLYDTFGFPLELMQEILQEKGLELDENGFKAEMEAQKSRARAARGASSYMGSDETVYNQLPNDLKIDFCGYTEDEIKAEIIALISGNEIVQEVSAGQEAAIFLNRTPFYAESGGQKGDTGTIGDTNIVDCLKVASGYTAHIGKIEKGSLKVGDTVTATIDAARRMDIKRNHSATHLLQKALREVLGDHVEQAGSEVSRERLRFDFTHTASLTPEEKISIEHKVNEKIYAGLNIAITETTPEKAREMGATALFGEKYGDTVRVVNIGDWSIELCGGTHVTNTQTIGLFKLLSESSVASGVRRIEAATGIHALAFYWESYGYLTEAAAAGKTTPDQLSHRIETLLQENKQLKKDIAKGSAKTHTPDIGTLLKNAIEYKGFSLLIVKLEGLDAEALRHTADQLRNKITSGALLLCGVNENAVNFIASATDDAVKAGIHVGQVIKEAAAICGGGGGGRHNHAQAGGKDASKTDEALSVALEIMKKQLG